MLDAPALQDDFYLNLVDWSAQNVLAVGLGTCVYLWSACTSKVCLSPVYLVFVMLQCCTHWQQCLISVPIFRLQAHQRPLQYVFNMDGRVEQSGGRMDGRTDSWADE